MESDQLKDPINSESLSQFKLSLETNLELLLMPPKLTPFFIKKKVFSLLTRKSEEIQNTLVVLWTLLNYQNLINPSECFMISKEDSDSSQLKDKRKISNFAEFRRNSLDQIKSATLLPMMEEPLNSFLLIFRSKILSNTTLKLELLMVYINSKLATLLSVPKVTTLVESVLFKL